MHPHSKLKQVIFIFQRGEIKWTSVKIHYHVFEGFLSSSTTITNHNLHRLSSHTRITQHILTLAQVAFRLQWEIVKFSNITLDHTVILFDASYTLRDTYITIFSVPAHYYFEKFFLYPNNSVTIECWLHPQRDWAVLTVPR